MIPVKIYTQNLMHEYGLPAYANAGDSGMDIRANTSMQIRPKETVMIPTGVFVGLPEGYEIQVRPRSGLSLKTKMRIANSTGTVDQGYTGEICIIAENTHDSVEFNVSVGERIAQIVLQEVPKITWVIVGSREELGSTERGVGGFGSSGMK